ncbi:hypothetical protein F5Y07DRAFT_379054 [Xylaria sp. FL0933]|nr:hypothetical protein F5Y07DRAFT_379054 [Xylaria sp. FL0933]
MQLSVEAVVAIVALFTALPPIVVIIIKLYRQYRSQRLAQTASHDTAGLDREPMIRDPVTSPPSSQPAAVNLPWRTIRMVIEEGSQTQLFEITRDRQSEGVISSGPDVHPLADRITDHSITDRSC